MATTLRDTMRDTAVSRAALPVSVQEHPNPYLSFRHRALMDPELILRNQQGARVGGRGMPVALQKAEDARRRNALAATRRQRPDGVHWVNNRNVMMRWGAEQPAASTQSNNLSRGDEANDLEVRDRVSPLRPGFMVHNDEFHMPTLHCLPLTFLRRI